MVKKEWIDKGFVDEPVAKELDLKSEIRELCRKKNAVIMAHYYTEGIIQDLADFVGDSLALAQKAAKTEADIIVMCGVHFMGETNKILCPDKKVLVPDLNATCSLAESCPADEFSRFVSAHLVRQYYGCHQGCHGCGGHFEQRPPDCGKFPF